MTSDEYWQERSVSWRNVAAGFTLAALAMTGLLVLEVTTHFSSGPGVSLPVAESNALLNFHTFAHPANSADAFSYADSLPDEDEHLFDCPHCE